MESDSVFRQHRAPLAERMRPRSLETYVGQEQLVGEGRLIRRAIEEDSLGSMLLWGPPGSGKTALARVIAEATHRTFITFSAVLQGVKEVREIVAAAKERLERGGKGTILFVDEIHRFSKSQQDSLLPHVEAGTVILIGATTENPSFEVNRALLSRCRVYTLHPLGEAEIARIVERALTATEHGLAPLNPLLTDEAHALLVNIANGDARTALNALELAVTATPPNPDGIREVSVEVMREALSSRTLAFDKGGEEHYNLISALHKSVRGSDPQAALYWLGRMLEAGADPLYIARRLVRMASEDIGLADPQGLVQAIAAKEAAHLLGYPECDCALAQATLYLATAPKSNAIEVAVLGVKRQIAEARNEPVPLHLRNAPTALLKELGYGKRYLYDHDAPDRYSGQRFFPDEVEESEYYTPGSFGFEKEIQKRLDYWARLREKRRGGAGHDER